MRSPISVSKAAWSAVAALSAFAAAPAAAELPDPVRRMIAAAIAMGDEKTVEAVVQVAKTTNPDEVAQIDRLYQGFKDTQQALAAAHEADK